MWICIRLDMGCKHQHREEEGEEGMATSCCLTTRILVKDGMGVLRITPRVGWVPLDLLVRRRVLLRSCSSRLSGSNVRRSGMLMGVVEDGGRLRHH